MGEITAQQAAERIEAALRDEPTPGPWFWYEDEMHNLEPSALAKIAEEYECPPRPIIQTDSGVYGPTKPTREFIAACNPVAIAALLAERRELLARQFPSDAKCDAIAARLVPLNSQPREFLRQEIRKACGAG